MSDDKKNTANDAQAEALIAALAPKIAEAIIPQLSEQVETQIKGIVKKNDELLDKLHSMKKDDSDLAAAAAKLANSTTYKQSGPLQISRADARDVAKYRAAKAEAEKRGVALQIVQDGDGHAA